MTDKEFSESFYRALDSISDMSDDAVLDIFITPDGKILEITEK